MALSFFGISRGQALAGNVLRINDLVHATESALGLWEEDLHVLEGATTDQDTGISVDWAALGLNGDDINHESAIFVLLQNLILLDGINALGIWHLIDNCLQRVLRLVWVIASVVFLGSREA